MTIRGGGDPPQKPWLPSRCEEWARRPGALPPMRMTASWFRSSRIDRIQGCGAISAPDRELPSELSSPALAGRKLARPTEPAAVLVTVKGKSLRDGLWPPLTVTARGGQSMPGRDEEMIASWSNKEMKIVEDRLDSNRPIQGFRMPAARKRCLELRRPASESLQWRNPRERVRGRCGALYGDLSAACGLKVE
jgi:hypothetical protein